MSAEQQELPFHETSSEGTGQQAKFQKQFGKPGEKTAAVPVQHERFTAAARKRRDEDERLGRAKYGAEDAEPKMAAPKKAAPKPEKTGKKEVVREQAKKESLPHTTIGSIHQPWIEQVLDQRFDPGNRLRIAQHFSLRSLRDVLNEDVSSIKSAKGVGDVAFKHIVARLTDVQTILDNYRIIHDFFSPELADYLGGSPEAPFGLTLNEWLFSRGLVPECQKPLVPKLSDPALRPVLTERLSVKPASGELHFNVSAARVDTAGDGPQWVYGLVPLVALNEVLRRSSTSEGCANYLKELQVQGKAPRLTNNKEHRLDARDGRRSLILPGLAIDRAVGAAGRTIRL